MLFKSFKAYNDIFHYYNMKECVFLSNNQDGIVENCWIMYFLNATNVLINSINWPELVLF